MYDQFESLLSHLAGYRKAVDCIVSGIHPEPEEWRRYFYEILVCTTQLYLDYLLFMREVPALRAISSNLVKAERSSIDIDRERALRNKLREHLESSPNWVFFAPSKNPFSSSLGLYTLADYIDRFSIHLAEVYEVTFRLEHCAIGFSKKRSGQLLAQMTVDLEEVGRDHIGFVLQALDWIGWEPGWTD